MTDADTKVLLDAARMLEAAARIIKRHAHAQSPTELDAHAISCIDANINAALARLPKLDMVSGVN